MGNQPGPRRRPRRRVGLPTAPDGSRRGCAWVAAWGREFRTDIRCGSASDTQGRGRRREQAGSDPLTVLDAQAIVAFLLDEPAAAAVEATLRDPAQEARISALNVAEIVDVMTRIYERAPADTANALVLLESGGLQIALVDGEIGITAGELHARRYDRRTSPLSMADCVALATAMILREPLATSDPPLAAAARSEGVVVIGLPDAKGRGPDG